MMMIIILLRIQAGAVLIFKGETFSLVYMLLNSWCLIWTVYGNPSHPSIHASPLYVLLLYLLYIVGAQYVQHTFEETADDIIYSDTSTCLGTVRGYYTASRTL